MKLTTTRLQLPSPRAWWNLSTPVAATICCFVLLAIAGIVGQLRSAQQAAAVPTPALNRIIVIATAAPAPTPAPQLARYQPPAAAVPYVVGFDSPNGHALGAIPAPAAGAIVARFGDAWLETTHDGAPIWVRASELGMGLADIAPTAAPEAPVVERPVYVVSAPAAPAEAAPTPVPAVPTLAPQQLVILDREQWALQAQRAGR